MNRSFPDENMAVFNDTFEKDFEDLNEFMRETSRDATMYPMRRTRDPRTVLILPLASKARELQTQET